MTTPCPSCGSDRNPIGAIVCVACKTPLSSIPSTHLPPAALLTASGRFYKLSSTTPTLVGCRGCAIMLSGTGIESQHLKISPCGGGYILEPLMGTVSVDGKIITSTFQLIPGAIIAIGSETLTYSGPAAAYSLSPITKPLPPKVASNPVSSRGGPLPVWTGSNPSVRGIVRDVDYKSSTHSTSNSGSSTSHRFWIRVEESPGMQTVVNLNSLPISNVTIGDDVGFWGKWKNGVLFVDRSFNYTTKAIIRSGWLDMFSF